MAATVAGFSSPGDQLSEAIYQELRRRAQWFLNYERPGHSLQPTEIVHEAWLRLASVDHHILSDRAHFLASAGCIMRHILVDHARARQAARRGGDLQRIDLDHAVVFTDNNIESILVVDEALSRLASWDARSARLVELRFFGGLTESEVAEALKVSERTVKRDWKMAKTWLRAELDQQFPPDSAK